MDFVNIALTISLGLFGINLFKQVFYLFSSCLFVIKQRRILRKAYRFSQNDLEKMFKVSVIVPAWNEEVGIKRTLKSLLKNSFMNMEIIVVNDGSTDNTSKIVKEYLKTKYCKNKKKRGKSILFIDRKENKGKACSMNEGLMAASGNVIVTTDADTIFDKEAIRNITRYFTDARIDALVGNVKVSSGSFLGTIQEMEYTLGFYLKRALSFWNAEYIIGGALGAFRSRLVEEIGLFDTKCKTEDIEYSTRIQNAGKNTFYAEDVIAYTEGANTFKSLLKQRLRWKKGRTDTFLKYKNLFLSTDKKHNKILTLFILPLAVIFDLYLAVEPFIIGLIYYFLIKYGSFQPVFMFLGVMLYLLLTAYLFGSKKNNLKNLLLAPVFGMLCYLLSVTEIYAFWGSLILYSKGKDVIWQDWQRKGVKNV